MKLFLFNDLGTPYIIAARDENEACRVLLQSPSSHWVCSPVIPKRMEELPFCKATCDWPMVLR